ncbi:MAG: hypothetical protein Q9160_005682 [Pyrenula sp. 1 TL-2023]
MSGKRKKTAINGETKPNYKSKARRASSREKPAAERQAVSQDHLRWQKVAIPETLEDAEGFYGLEEIDDVESAKREASSPDLSNDDEQEWSGIDSSSPTSTHALESNVPYTALPESAGDDFDLSAWAQLDLSSQALVGIASLKFTDPTPIQSACIPQILGGHDVVGKASTGSGKTLAYGIPILESYVTTPAKDIVALILAPTRELAHQISSHLSQLNGYSGDTPKIATVTGGLSIQKQQRQLADCNIVIATPGRLWDIVESTDLRARLTELRFLVIDEADRLLSEGHFAEVEQILDSLSSSHQTLVFSATFQKGLQQSLNAKGDLLNNQQSMAYLLRKLAFRKRPKFIDVNPVSQMVEGLKEGLLECSAAEKDLYLYALLLYHSSARVLVFTNSISSVRRLVHLLQYLNLRALALHSSMVQKARLRSIEKFSTGAIMVATDVAARGLDIKGIDLIVHYHVPRTADMYVHRSGRTARADHPGKSVLICSPDEAGGVVRLITKVHASQDRLLPLEIDGQLISRLRPRVTLASRIANASVEKEKNNSQDQWLRKAAEELGADFDSDEFAAEESRLSRGRKRNQKSANVKSDIVPLRAQLRDLLAKPMNLGVSERYIAGGNIDVKGLLNPSEIKIFLGRVGELEF